MSLRKLGQLCKISKSSLQQYESLEEGSADIDIFKAQRVAEALGVPYDILVLADNYSSKIKQSRRGFKSLAWKDVEDDE